ncbi:hypothetical protein [Bremerella volcania]|nr:hypothetical protein [Bremerella volcania]
MTEFNFREALKAAIDQLRSEGVPNGFIELHNSGYISSREVKDNIFRHCVSDNSFTGLIQKIEKHPESWVRDIAEDLKDTLQRIRDRITDLDEIERSSPLKPGARIFLTGGYEHPEPWWLAGRDGYWGTFVRFAPASEGAMPIAFVKLDQEIHRIEAVGTRHEGVCALLRLTGVAAKWESSGTVTIHVVQEFPQDVATFYDEHPFGTELEWGATYQLKTLAHET